MATPLISADQAIEFEALRLRGRLIVDATHLSRSLADFASALGAPGASIQRLNPDAFVRLTEDFATLVAKLDAVDVIRQLDPK